MRLFSDENGDPRTGLRCQTAARTHRGGTFGKAHQTMTCAYPLDRAGRRHMAPEISAERMAYTARRQCLLLSDAGARDDRANFGDARTGRRLEENVRRKAKFGIGELSQVFEG
jgi:hypothetical protein